MAGLDRRVPEADRPLTDPVSFGGDAADSFDVVVPSLPGFGFSRSQGDRVDCIAHRKRVAELMKRLGYTRWPRKAATGVPSSPPPSGPCNLRGFSEFT